MATSPLPPQTSPASSLPLELRPTLSALTPSSLSSRARTSTPFATTETYLLTTNLLLTFLSQLISEGSAKLASVPSGGGGGAAAAGGAAAGGAAEAAPVEEKEEEKEESDEDMGFGLFD